MGKPIDSERHHDKMVQRKELHDKKMAEKTADKGLLIVHTGTGKGKSSSAFGMVMRGITHGFNIGIVQFIKGDWESGERDVLMKFPEQVEIHAMGEGFTWETQDRERDIEVTKKAWEKSKEFIEDPNVKMVVLDELNIALRYDYLELDDVIETLKNRAADKHIIVTGRNAKPELIEVADLVTEMKLIKHPFKEQGIKAQKGIEY
ncbi:cob(I)yrinic acid a,c-diamide adenosyltransferase [Hyphomicrobiales bacterium 4NK60-0047b]|jgi:cob(I)alamin adenosyltransferase